MTPLEWKGEHFDRAEGGIFVRAKMVGFKGKGAARTVTSPIQMTFFNPLSGKTYLISMEFSALGLGPRQIWKLPAGKYEVQGVSLVDALGVRRTWKSTKSERRLLVVRRQCLSNLGQWSFSPSGPEGLRVQFAMQVSDYHEDGPKDGSSVAAVIDGFSGLVQEAVGGKRVLEASKSQFETASNMRQAIRYTRQISMFYRLDLFKHNFHGREISKVLDNYDGVLRKCYTDALDNRAGLKGDLHFTFLLSKETGTIGKLRHSGGTILDPTMTKCIYLNLAQMQFPAPQTMVGEIRYTFDFQE